MSYTQQCDREILSVIHTVYTYYNANRMDTKDQLSRDFETIFIFEEKNRDS